MSVGPMGGVIGSAMGVPFAQTKGSEVERAQQESANQTRHVQSDTKADSAAGVGATDHDEAAEERDADGRRLWEEPLGKKKEDSTAAESPTPDSPNVNRVARDASGQCGGQLDLTG